MLAGIFFALSMSLGLTRCDQDEGEVFAPYGFKIS